VDTNTYQTLNTPSIRGVGATKDLSQDIVSYLGTV